MKKWFFAFMILLLLFISACVPAYESKESAKSEGAQNDNVIIDQTAKNESRTETADEHNHHKTNDKQQVRNHHLKQDIEPKQLNQSNQTPNEPNHQNTNLTQSNTQSTKQSNVLLPASRKVRGIYVSGYTAGSSRMNKMIQLVDTTELNAMVIDVKNDYGKLTYNSSIPLAKQIASDKSPSIANLSSLIKKCKSKNIYLIARIVTFKDPYLAGKKKEWAIQRKTGGIWRNSKGVAWVDPYREEVQQYNIDIAKEVARLGFDEIQFDYVRFPENGPKVDREAKFANSNHYTKAQAIHYFLKEARKQLHAEGVYVSADVFGLVTSENNDMGIGQEWTSISSVVDIICPMVYPSHYSQGMYGIRNPDLNPTAIIARSMKDGTQRNGKMKQSGNKPAIIRPWLQDFTATWVHPHQTYGVKQIRQQIDAAKSQGVDEYLLWDPSNKYSIK